MSNKWKYLKLYLTKNEIKNYSGEDIVRLMNFLDTNWSKEFDMITEIAYGDANISIEERCYEVIEKEMTVEELRDIFSLFDINYDEYLNHFVEKVNNIGKEVF